MSRPVRWLFFALLLSLSLGPLAWAAPDPRPAQDQIYCTVYHEDSDMDGVGDLWVCGSGSCTSWGDCQGKTHSIDMDGDGSYETDVTIDSCRCH